MRKGDLVQLNVDVCFTEQNGGKRRFPLTNWHNDNLGIVRGFYKLTRDQRQEWRDRLHENIKAGNDVGYDSAGESKLAPSEGLYDIAKGSVYCVIRSRAQAVYNYRKTGRLTKLLDTRTGKEVYIKRDLLEVVSET